MSLLDRRRFLGSLMAGGAAAKGLANRLWGQVSSGIRPARNANLAYRIQSPNLTVELSREGNIVGAVLGKRAIRWPVQGRTSLAGCRVEGSVEAEERKDGGVRFKKKLVGEAGGTRREVTLYESFFPTKDSVRWEMRLDGRGSPWSTPIETRLRIPNAEAKRIWTTWGDPRPDENAVPSWGADPSWRDPLTPTVFRDRLLWYGAAYYTYNNPRIGVPSPFRDVFCIPLATILDDKNDLGLSLALSPEDILLDMTLQFSGRGKVNFSRLFRRISEGKAVNYSMDIIVHEGEWRGGLRWMTSRYANFFHPPLASSERLGGTAAYSSYEGPLNVEQFKRMAFRANWKADFDFPYQGMFIPPVPDNQSWHRGNAKTDSPPIRLEPTTSIPQLVAYSHRMREMGFDVLNYYNAAEFGRNIIYPPPPLKRKPSDPDLWKDPNDYLNTQLSEAILFRPAKEAPTPGGARDTDPYYRAYAHNVVLDWGEPCWQNFLLEQARRLIQKIPDSAGICFDRLDWLRLYNHRRDDGLSWYYGPARSLVWSWNDLMEKLGPIQHNAGQVIFVNNLVSRIDILRQVDGLFNEMSHWGGALNSTALLAVFKPAIGWVLSERTLKEVTQKWRGGKGLTGWVFGEESSTAETDAFLQKFLYMGVFPMAPFPQNDHSILPNPRANRFYMDYGPLFEAMRGRKWVLRPHVIRVEGEHAKANLFKVPGGYVVPVTFGDSAASVTVSLRGIPEILAGKTFRCEVIHPGEIEWQECAFRGKGSAVTLKVPLARGCAMVRLLLPASDHPPANSIMNEQG